MMSLKNILVRSELPCLIIPHIRYVKPSNHSNQDHGPRLLSNITKKTSEFYSIFLNKVVKFKAIPRQKGFKNGVNQSIMAALKSTSQKYLGAKGFIVFIAFISAFIPLSTDLYLPALPHMAENFGAAPGLVNLTLVLFFVFYALGTLIWGPLSDKYGRKRILITGLTIYVAASILCALSMSIIQLIIYRVIQAIGSGAVIATGTAIVKDTYDGKKRLAVLAVVQSMVMIAPIVAPVIGAQLLNFTSWRGVFGVLALIGFLAFLGGLAMEETLGPKERGNCLSSNRPIGGRPEGLRIQGLLTDFLPHRHPFDGLCINLIIYLPEWVWYKRTGFQFLFCRQCGICGYWTAIIDSTGAAVAISADNHGLLYSHCPERDCGLHRRPSQPLVICRGNNPGDLSQWRHSPPEHPPDVGACPAGYRIGFLAHQFYLYPF